MVRYLRKLNDVSAHKKKRFCTISIPSEFMDIFTSDYASVTEILVGIRGVIVSPVEKPMGKVPKSVRKLMNINPKAGRFLTVSIPTPLLPIFDTDWVLIEPIQGSPGLIIRPADIKAA